MARKHENVAGELERPESLGQFGGLLRQCREGLGMTLDVLAAKTGISKPYLSNIETGRAPGPPSEEKLRRIAGALALVPGVVVRGADWLRTPESVRRLVGKMGRAEEMPRRADETIDLDRMLPGAGKSGEGFSGAESFGEAGARGGDVGVRAVPVINRVPAGKAGEYGDMDYPAGVADAYVPVPDVPEASVASAFAVRVTGDSMWPEYAEGEMVVVGPGEATDGEACVVRLGEGSNFATTFKRVFMERDGEGEVTAIRLAAVNPKYADRRVMLEEVSGIYPVMYRVVPAKRGGTAPTVSATQETPRVDSIMSRVSIEND